MLYIVASIAVLFILYYLFKHFRLISQTSAYPHVSQLLPMVPIKIPFLAPHIFIGSHRENAYVLQNQCADHKACFVTAGTNQLLLTGNANDIKLLTITKAAKVIKPSEMAALEMFGPNIVTIPGYAEWRRHRILCNPSFSDNHLRFVAQVAVESANLLMKRWEQRGIVPDKDMSDLTLDVIGKVGFGYNLGVLEQQNFETKNHQMTFKDALEYVIRVVLPLRFMLPDVISLNLPSVKKALREVDQYMDEIIESKTKTEHKQYDLLSMLCTLNESSDLVEDPSLEEFKTGARTKLSFQEIKSDTFIFLFAGHDTTSVNLQWILYEMAKNKKIQERVYEEVMSVIGNRDPTMDDFKSLPYMMQVINESLRLHPPVGFVYKTTTEAMNLSSGIPVPAGFPILICIYSAHTDPDYWEDPMTFNPDRFAEKKHHPYAFVPFSSGHRSCIGAQFSLLETTMILTKFVQNYEFDFPADFDFTTVTESREFIKKPSPCRLKLKKREY